MGSLERGGSTGFFRPGLSLETSPPPSMMYAQSPPNMEGPITFVAPELAEETLMDVGVTLYRTTTLKEMNTPPCPFSI